MMVKPGHGAFPATNQLDDTGVPAHLHARSCVISSEASPISSEASGRMLQLYDNTRPGVAITQRIIDALAELLLASICASQYNIPSLAGDGTYAASSEGSESASSVRGECIKRSQS